MADTDQVERVARALARRSWEMGGNEHAAEEFVARRWPHYVDDARAAINALGDERARVVLEPEVEGEDGWSDWIHPVPAKDHGYLLQCCDCKLIHEMEFAIAPAKDGEDRFNEGETEDAVIVFRARRLDTPAPDSQKGDEA